MRKCGLAFPPNVTAGASVKTAWPLIDHVRHTFSQTQDLVEVLTNDDFWLPAHNVWGSPNDKWEADQVTVVLCCHIDMPHVTLNADVRMMR